MLQVEDRIAQRAVVLLELPFVQDGVDRRQDDGRAEAVRREPTAERPRSNQLAGERAVERGGNALARHVANGNHEGVGLGRQEVVQIAPQLARRREPRGDVHPLHPLRQLGRQQRRLHPLRESQLVLQSLLVGANRLVEPRVLDGHRRLAGEQRHHFLVALREGVELGALEVDHADAAVLHHQRDHQLGPHVVHQVDVTRVGLHVGHEHDLLVLGRVTHQALPHLHRRDGRLLVVLQRELHLQLVGRLVHQQDAERPVVDQPLGQLRDPRQQRVEVEDRRHLAADLGQRLEHVGILPLPLEQAGVLDRHRHGGRELPEDGLVELGELRHRGAEQVEGANDLALAEQRHDQLRPGARHDLDVAGIGEHVVHQDRARLGDRRSDDALADLQPHVPDLVFRVADGIGDVQVAAAFVDEVGGERRELGQAADHLRDLLQQLVEVQHRRHLPSKVEQRRQQLGVGGSGRRGCGRAGSAIGVVRGE